MFSASSVLSISRRQKTTDLIARRHEMFDECCLERLAVSIAYSADDGPVIVGETG
jgi:hypothetical protein